MTDGQRHWYRCPCRGYSGQFVPIDTSVWEDTFAQADGSQRQRRAVHCHGAGNRPPEFIVVVQVA